MITVLYFASLREALGTESEQFELPPGVTDAGGVLDCLVGRGAPWGEVLGETGRNLMAVNQEMADRGTPVRDGDEVAFFPPVTGG